MMFEQDSDIVLPCPERSINLLRIRKCEVVIVFERVLGSKHFTGYELHMNAAQDETRQIILPSGFISGACLTRQLREFYHTYL